MMKTLLALPRFEPNTNPPLGIAQIAACMRQQNLEADILDPTFEGFEYARRELKRRKYDILGLSCFTMNINVSMELAKIAKKANPKVFVLIGGVHPTIIPEDTLKEKIVDAVAIGEGEITIPEIVKALSKGKDLRGVKGVYFKDKNGKIVKNKPRPMIDNLDSLPLAARDLLPMDKYLHAAIGRSAWAVKQPSTSIMTSRGCPFSCTYCSTWLTFGKKVRFRSAKHILMEIEHMVENYGIKGLSFVDDTFTLRPKLVEEVCDGIIEKGWKLEWICHTRVDTVSEALFRKMKKAGCRVVALGIESGDQWILDNILKKGIKLGQIKKALGWARNAGLITDAYFMLGSPGESLEQMEKTIKFAKDSLVDYANFNVTRPMPRTEMHDLAKKYGTLTVNSWDDYEFSSKPIFESKDWTAEQVAELKRRAYREFYFNPRYVLRQLTSIRGLYDVKRIWHGVQMILKVSS